jgi:outer membrane receptor protein involved in Fe transport
MPGLRIIRSRRAVCGFLWSAAIAVVAALAAARAGAQELETGRIVGRVVDANTGQGIIDAGVQVAGTSLATQTGVDGRFSLARVAVGAVTLQVRRIGFAAKTVTGLAVAAGRTIEQNVSLSPSVAQLGPQVVTASIERGTVNEALDQQRTAVGVVNAVTAEQIAKSPDGDAAQAVQRVSGVTVQDGRYVFVRGLGERYTTASLNGARVPSPEPEKRVVPLDLFPSGLLQTVTTTKTFTPDQQGDFAGALVDIKTREFPARRTVTAQFVGGYTAGSSGAKAISPRGVGGEELAMVGSGRELPSLVASLGNFQGIALNHTDQNTVIKQFRNAWTPTTTTAPPNSSASLSIGGDDPVIGHRIGYLVSGSYAFSTDLKDNQQRALADRGNTPGETKPIDVFTGQSSNQSMLWGGLANLSTMFGDGSRVAFNGMYNRTADNEARVETGHFENEGIDAKITRMHYVQRAVHSAQLTGEHQYAGHRLDWAMTASGVRRDEPDRSEFVQAMTPATSGGQVLRWLSTGNGGAVRTFSALDEHSVEGKGDYQWSFNALGREHALKIGGLGRQTTRSSDVRAYSISAPGAGDSVTLLEPEQIFDGRFLRAGDSVFTIGPLAQGGSYDAHDNLAAAYVMTELGLSARARLIGGARVERDRLTVNALSTLGSPLSIHKDWNDVLPSLALTVQVAENQQTRFSVSRTLARPEYREIAPIETRDVLNGDDVLGNDELQRTNVMNADARWEWYPRSGEILSIGVFSKQFTNPIERVYQAAGSGTRVVFYTNAKSATNYGVELEARKSLGVLTPALDRFQGFANVTVMESRIHLGSDTRASATNTSRRMVGQAPYVVNGGLTYLAQGNSVSATVLFNRVGPRIFAAGDRPLPDVIEEPRNSLDVSLRLPVAGAFSARIDAKNLLDDPYLVRQGTVTRERYTTGQVVQAGLVWRP